LPKNENASVRGADRVRIAQRFIAGGR